MKTKHILLPLIAFAIILTSCNSYRKISYSKTSVFEKKAVNEKIKDYDIYVHQDDKTFLLEQTSVSEEVLSGVPVEIDPLTNDTGDTLNDMHLILTKSADEIPTDGSVHQFDQEEVEEVKMYGRKRSTGANIFLIILAGIGGTILMIALIIGSLWLASDNSDSGSDSGGSDSGGSDSGGSSCYIATMSYGSYDAPQVLVLREFRDRFLNKFSAGRSFIAWYYRTSPSFVEKHRSRKWLHAIIRVPLTGFVLFLRLFYSGDRAKN